MNSIVCPRPIRTATGLCGHAVSAGARVSPHFTPPSCLTRMRRLLAKKTPSVPKRAYRVVSSRGGKKGPLEIVSAVSGLSPPLSLIPKQTKATGLVPVASSLSGGADAQ
jgi:hypothetical protein